MITKTLLASAIGLGLSFGAMAGVQDGINVDEVKGTITFFTNRTDLLEAGVFDRYEQEFKELYPKVDSVKVIAFADYRGSIRPRMNTNDYGDLLFVLPSVPSDQYKNFYEPLNGLYAEDEVYFL